MTTTIIGDLRLLLDGLPAGAWVAVSEKQHRVMAYGADAQNVLDEARANGEEQPLIMRVPQQEGIMFL